MRTLARGVGYAAAILSLPLLSGSCERVEGPTRLAIGVHAEPGVLLPVLAAGDVGAEISGMLYLGLNSAVWGDGALDYRLDDRSLAEAWEFSADSQVVTYALLPSLVWSDGHPIDADDVVFTYELIAREEISSPLAGVWEHLDSVVAQAPDRVSFYFEERYPGQLFDTGVGIIPQHLYEEVASGHATLAGHRSLSVAPQELVVSGPYRLAAWDRGESLVLEPNPAYRGAPPRIERVILRLIPDETVRRAELQNGSIDAARAVSPSRAAEFAADAGFQVASSKGRFYDFIAWNGDRVAALDDPLARRALSLAIDRRSILGGLEMGEHARPAGGPYPEVFERLADPGVEPDPFLPDSASALLARQGWRDSDGDGVLERNGQAFRFTNDRPYAFLWFFDELVVLNEHVRDYRIDTYGVFQNLHRWTVAPQ